MKFIVGSKRYEKVRILIEKGLSVSDIVDITSIPYNYVLSVYSYLIKSIQKKRLEKEGEL